MSGNRTTGGALRRQVVVVGSEKMLQRRFSVAPMMDGARRAESLLKCQWLIKGEQSSCYTRRRTFLEGRLAG